VNLHDPISAYTRLFLSHLSPEKLGIDLRSHGLQEGRLGRRDGINGQRILSPMKAPLPDLNKRYEPVSTGLAVVKVSSGLAYYQHVAPPS
jgi:hypothetical protein